MPEEKKCPHCEWWKREDRPHETFRFGWGAFEWDVDKAKEIVAGREPQETDIANVANAVDYPVEKTEDGVEHWRIDRVHVLEEHVDHVDPDEPIILGWYPAEMETKGNVVLDGHHRIARNIKDGTGRIFYHLLTQEESDSICTSHLPPKPKRRKRHAKR